MTFGVCDFSRLALTALALVVFGAYDSYPWEGLVGGTFTAHVTSGAYGFFRGLSMTGFRRWFDIGYDIGSSHGAPVAKRRTTRRRGLRLEMSTLSEDRTTQVTHLRDDSSTGAPSNGATTPTTPGCTSTPFSSRRPTLRRDREQLRDPRKARIQVRLDWLIFICPFYLKLGFGIVIFRGGLQLYVNFWRLKINLFHLLWSSKPKVRLFLKL